MDSWDALMLWGCDMKDSIKLLEGWMLLNAFLLLTCKLKLISFDTNFGIEVRDMATLVRRYSSGK
jgi:hypothetical protein